jgi:hypothetical protein
MNEQRWKGRNRWSLLAAGVGIGLVAATCGSSLARDDHGGDDSSHEVAPGDDLWKQPEARGGRPYSNQSIKGHWGYNTSFGMLMPPIVPQPQATAAMGRISFDGGGGCDVKAVVNIEGQSMTMQSASCSYHVDPDGTGIAQALFPGAPIADAVPVAFVIVDAGQELRFVNTRHIVGTFTARRQ